MEKWYNVETRFLSFKNALKDFLLSKGIKFEISGADSYYHIEALLTSENLDLVNAWIDENSITEN